MMRLRGNPIFHLLDRYIGIPTLAVLTCTTRRRELPCQINKIGLLRMGAIGDTVLLSGVIADLRVACPGARLTLFASESNYEMAQLVPGVDAIVKVPVANLARALIAVRSVDLDVMLDFGQWSRFEALLCVISKASCRVGFRTPRQFRHYGYDLVVDHLSDVHELENYRRIVKAIGVEAGNVPILHATGRNPVGSRDYLVFHLWPGGRRRMCKQWPLSNWLELINEFTGYGITVVLTGGPADRDLNESVIARLGSVNRALVINAAGLDLCTTTALLSGARLVVSVDTGIMHIAAALNVPLVALHGPSSSKRWGPISKNAIVVESKLPGCGYISLGWEDVSPALDCMAHITYDDVSHACRQVLEVQSQRLESSGHKQFHWMGAEAMQS